MYFSRLSTIFGVQQSPFHPNTYAGEDQKPVIKVDEFGQKKLRQAPAHIIRWRHTRNNKGEKVRQSNAKLVRWSDGALCLYVGEERFIVTESDLKVPYLLCTKSSAALHSQGSIAARLMFQPTSKSIASRGAHRAAPALEQPVVITPNVQYELKARAEAQEESARLNQQSSKKRKSGPAVRLDADFLEEGSDIGATKAHYRSQAALVRERASSQRLMEIKSGNKRQKLSEYDDDDSDSFIASEDEDSDHEISD